jgi:hypothetical protein
MVYSPARSAGCLDYPQQTAGAAPPESTPTPPGQNSPRLTKMWPINSDDLPRATCDSQVCGVVRFRPIERRHLDAATVGYRFASIPAQTQQRRSAPLSRARPGVRDEPDALAEVDPGSCSARFVHLWHPGSTPVTMTLAPRRPRGWALRQGEHTHVGAAPPADTRPLDHSDNPCTGPQAARLLGLILEFGGPDATFLGRLMPMSTSLSRRFLDEADQTDSVDQIHPSVFMRLLPPTAGKPRCVTRMPRPIRSLPWRRPVPGCG